MMSKYNIERIDQEIEKLQSKIANYQERLKALEAKRTEAENLEIVQIVRALHLTPAELSALLFDPVPSDPAPSDEPQEANMNDNHNQEVHYE